MNCSVEEALKSTPSAYAPELAKLSLVGKHIGTLIHSPVAIAKNVQTLYLSNNNLKTLEGLSDYSNLKCLSCTNNCIRYLGDLKWLRQTPLIEKLSFVGNPVTAMPFYREHLISICPNVTVIDSRNVLLKEKLDSKITAKKAQLFYNQLRLNDLRICILIHLNKLTRCHLQIQQRIRSGYKSHLASHIQSPVPQTRTNTIDINQTRIWSDILGSQYIESVLRVILSGGVFHSLQVECSDDFDRHIQETAYQLHATRVTNMTSADKVHLSSSYIYMSKHWESVLAEYLDSQHKLSFQLLNDTANLSISSVGSSSTSATNKVNSKLNMRKATQSNDDTIRSSHDESNLNSPPSRISTLMLPDNGPQEGSIASKSKQNESVSTAGPSSIKDSIIYLDQIFFIQPTNADTSIATDTNTKFSAYPTSNQSSPILPTSNAPKKQTTPTSTATSRPTLAPPKSSASPPRGLKTQNTKEPPITSEPYVVDLGPQLFPTKPYALTKTQKQAQALEATLNSMNSTQTRSVRSSSDKNLVTEQYNALVHRMKNSNTEPSINIHPNRISICDSLNSATIPSIDSSVNLSLQSLSLPPQQEEPDDDSTESSVTLVDESEIRFFIDKVIDSQYTNERQIAFRQISQVDVQSLFQLPKFDFEYIFEGTEELEVLLSGNANDESINNGTSANSHPFEFVNVAGIKSMKEMKSLVDLCTVELIRQQRAEAHFIARAEACSAAVQAHKDVVIRNVKSAEIYTNQFESYLQVYRDDITKAKQWVTVYKSSLDKIQASKVELDGCQGKVRELQVIQAENDKKQRALRSEIDEIIILNDRVGNAGIELRTYMRENMEVDTFLRRQSAMFILKGVLERLTETTAIDVMRTHFNQFRMRVYQCKQIKNLRQYVSTRSIYTYFNIWKHALKVQKLGQKISTWKTQTIKYDAMMTWCAEHRIAILETKFESYKMSRAMKKYFIWWNQYIKLKISHRQQRNRELELKSCIVIKRRIFNFLRFKAQIDDRMTVNEENQLTLKVHRLQLSNIFNTWFDLFTKKKDSMLDKYTIIVTKRYVSLMRHIFVAWLRSMVIFRFFRFRGYVRGISGLKQFFTSRRDSISSTQLNKIADLHHDCYQLQRGLNTLMQNSRHARSQQKCVDALTSRSQNRILTTYWLVWNHLFNTQRIAQVRYERVRCIADHILLRVSFSVWKGCVLVHNIYDQNSNSRMSESVMISNNSYKDDNMSLISSDHEIDSYYSYVYISSSIEDLTHADRRLCKSFFQRWHNRAINARKYFLNTINIRVRSKRVRMRAVLRFMCARVASAKYNNAIALVASINLCRLASGPEGVMRSKAMKDDIARITTRVGEAELTKKKLQKDIHRVSVITDNLTQEEQEINEAIRILTSEKARLKEATVTIQNEMGGLLGEISSLQIALHEQIESNEKRIEEIAQRNVVLASELREENRSLLSHVEEYHTKSLDAQAAAQEESKQTQQLVKKAKAQLAAAKRVYTDLDKQIKALSLSKIAVERDIEELSETLSYTAKTVAQQVSRQENENARLEDEGREYQGKLNASRMEEQLLLQELAQLKDELAALELAGNTSIQRSHTPNTRPAVHAEVQVSDKAHTAVIDPADTHIGGTQGFGRFVNKVLQSPGIQSTNGKAQNESSDMKFDYSSSGSDLIVPISSSFTQIDPETVMIPTSNQSSQIPISTSLSKVDIEINEVSTRIKNRLAGSSSL